MTGLLGQYVTDLLVRDYSHPVYPTHITILQVGDSGYEDETGSVSGAYQVKREVYNKPALVQMCFVEVTIPRSSQSVTL